MPRTVHATACALVVLALPLLAPAAAAWIAGPGSFEPSTVWDTPQHMFSFPSDDGQDRVYLNGVLIHSTGATGLALAYDPNVDGSTIVSPVAGQAFAFLGVWRDCNRDGYIGAKDMPAAFGRTEYPRGLTLTPIDADICPPGSPYNPTSSVNAPDGLIREFRWIGPADGCPVWECAEPGGALTCAGDYAWSPCVPACAAGECAVGPVTNDKYDLRDPLARVWADLGVPGERHVTSMGHHPLPRGATADSDGTLAYVDDSLGREVSRAVGPGWDRKPVVGRCGADPVLLGGPSSRLPVADRGTCGAWPLHQVQRLHNDSTCAPAGASRACSDPEPLVRTWDLESDSGGTTSSPCDDGFDQTIAGRRIAAPNLILSVHPNILVEGSLAGTLEHQTRAVVGIAAGDGQCRPDGIGLESDECRAIEDVVCDESVARPAHERPDTVLRYAPSRDRHLFAPNGFDNAPHATVAPLQGSNAVSDIYGREAGWFGDRTWSHVLPPGTGTGYTVKRSLTFYADVSCRVVANSYGQYCGDWESHYRDPAVALPGGVQDLHRYGREQCPAITTGASNVNPANGWECSRTRWDAARATLPASHATDPILGDWYDLRDTDCYDNAASGEVRLGIASCGG